MKRHANVLFLCATLVAASTGLQAGDLPAITYSRTPVATLENEARTQLHAKLRVNLSSEINGLDADSLEPFASGRTPNYLRSFAFTPSAAAPFAHLVKSALYTGAVEPETKMGMGLRIAQLLHNPYVAIHMLRSLNATPSGISIADALKSDKSDSLNQSQRLALEYAELLTQDVHGVSDADFRRIRAYFNDPQIVELTTTVCFFNFFTRYAAALNLPVEPWAVDTPASPVRHPYAAPVARVGLITDEQLKALDERLHPAKAQPNGLGIGFANSMRAMMQNPEMATAWFRFGNTVRGYDAVSREIKLQVSFAVSTANGCRYCTLHQVLGLRRLGVSPAKLMSMKKDDGALTPAELSAVRFARKLTREPAAVTDDDYRDLQKTFGDQGALEVTLQTCTFAFMNHFTDGLRLPSEDEAIKVYRETYGADWN